MTHLKVHRTGFPAESCLHARCLLFRALNTDLLQEQPVPSSSSEPDKVHKLALSFRQNVLKCVEDTIQISNDLPEISQDSISFSILATNMDLRPVESAQCSLIDSA